MRRRWWGAVVVVAALLATAAPAAAGPAPPPNPTDEDLRGSRAAVAERAGEVARLTGELAALNAQAERLDADLAARRETAFQRLLELDAAREEADRAAQRLAAVRVEGAAAAAAVADAQRRLDGLATLMFGQSVDLGPLGLLTDATSPDDLVTRAEFARVVAEQERRAWEGLQRARIGQANARSRAEEALAQAEVATAEAGRLSGEADAAVAAAGAAVADQERLLRELDGRRADVERQLGAARATDDTLRAQRADFEGYQRRAAEAEAARLRAAQAAQAVDPVTPPAAPGDVDRAAAQLGPEFTCRSRTPNWGPVKPWVAEAGNLLRCRFGVRTVGGVGPRPNPSEHPVGRALDFMVGDDRAAGDALAECAVHNRDRLAVLYVIFRQRINSGSGWRAMADRGSPVANHMEHVHISFRSSPGGRAGAVRC